MPALSEKPRVKTRDRAQLDVVPYHAPRNIAVLHGMLNDAGAGDNFIISGTMLRQLVDEVKASHPLSPVPRPNGTQLPAPLWIRPREAVAQYGIRTTLLYKLINEQRVNSKLIGGARVISVASLDALADAEPQARRRGRPRRNADAADLKKRGRYDY